MKKRLLFFIFSSLILASGLDINAECKLPNDESGMIYPAEVCDFYKYLNQPNNKPSHLVLYGPIASGKSYIAKKIAKLSGLKIVYTEISDTEEEIRLYNESKELCAVITTITTDKDERSCVKTRYGRPMYHERDKKDIWLSKYGVFIPLPDVEKRTTFVQYLLKKEKLDTIVPTKDVKKLINSTDGMSMYEIEMIIHNISRKVNIDGEKYSYSMVANLYADAVDKLKKLMH